MIRLTTEKDEETNKIWDVWTIVQRRRTSEHHTKQGQPRTLFVYGSLREGQPLHEWYLSGHKMALAYTHSDTAHYELRVTHTNAPFPYMVESDLPYNSYVYGEVTTSPTPRCSHGYATWRRVLATRPGQSHQHHQSPAFRRDGSRVRQDGVLRGPGLCVPRH